MKYIIKTPNQNYNGVTEGVAFANGQATIEDKEKADVLAINYGYKFEEVKEVKEKAPAKSKANEKK